MIKILYKQVKLKHYTSYQIVWLDTKKLFKVGDQITFQKCDNCFNIVKKLDDNRKWDVLWISKTSQEKQDVHDDWIVGSVYVSNKGDVNE